MITKGTRAHNHLTGSDWEVLEADAETGARGFLLRVKCPVGAAPDVIRHIHNDWHEDFTILSGNCAYRIGKDVRSASAGDVISMPPGRPHVHPWNTGTEPLVYEHRATFPGPRPGALDDTFGVFFTAFERSKVRGRFLSNGLPVNPLMLVAMGRRLGRHGNYLAALPIAGQKFTNATLGALVAALGVEPIDHDLIAALPREE